MASDTELTRSTTQLARRIKRWLRGFFPNRALAESLIEQGIEAAERQDLLGALDLFESALDANPILGTGWGNLGTCQYALGRYSEACDAFAQAHALGENSAPLFDNWGNALAKLDKLSEAHDMHTQAVTLEPNLPGVESNLGETLIAMGRPDEGADLTVRAWGKYPEDPNLASTALMRSLYGEKLSPQELAAGHRRWPGAAISRASAFSRANDPEHILRIGYVSSDFRVHSCACFLLPLFRAHHRESVEVFAYSTSHQHDPATTEFMRAADHWRDCASLSDKQVASQISHDEIDILVDCNGHTAGNRLPVFLFAPAPVQVTWLGYPFSTGLSIINARLTDIVADPKGPSDAVHSEALMRLPGGYHTYQPLVATPMPQRVPTREGQIIRFGVFHALAKYSDSSLKLWSEVIRACPGSILVIKARGLQDESVRNDVLSRLEDLGVGSDKVEVLPWNTVYGAHFEDYQAIDVVLDAFPYNGTTTTCEALWMGVPVVTLAGDRPSARAGASLLSQIGRQEWIASTNAEYVRIASDLASSTGTLDQMRVSLREEIRASTLGDASLFARSMESAFRKLWLDWTRTTDPDDENAKR